MFINPFLAGIIFTVLFEISLLVVYAVTHKK